MFKLVLTAFVLLLPLAAAQTSLDDGLVATYAFQGNTRDTSPNGNDAEVRGATLTTGHDDSADSAYDLDGQGSYLVIPHSESLSLSGAATFSLWWRHTAQAAQDQYYTLFEKSDPERGGHSRYGMWLIGDHVEVCIEVPDNSQQSCLDSEGTLDEGWHHVAATYDGASLRIYLDGAISGEQTVTPTGISQSAYEIFVGTDQYAPEPLYTKGAIDELRIYDRALSAQEVAALAAGNP